MVCMARKIFSNKMMYGIILVAVSFALIGCNRAYQKSAARIESDAKSEKSREEERLEILDLATELEKEMQNLRGGPRIVDNLYQDSKNANRDE